MNASISIRPATAEDAKALGVLGPAAYAGTYSYLWDRPDVFASHLESFSQHAFEALLAQSETHVWVAEHNSALVGFLSMIDGSLDPIEFRPNGAELPRIYFLGAAQRMGLGKRLLDAALERARAKKLSYVWLDVMASASWARSAYTKWGFRKIGVKRNSKPMKDDLRDMIIMTKDVEP